jgi:hypothetical protein
MKNSIVFLAAFLMTISTFAQSEKYTAMMQKNITEMESTRDGAVLQGIANKFERIANAEGNQWLPYYYHALCNIQMALAAMEKNEGDKMGAFIENAQTSLKKAQGLTTNNSELETLQGYVYMANIWESPMVKGATYGPKASASFEKAMKLDPNNPRPYLLKGQNLFFTPEFFGGGAEKAAPLFATAQEKFDTFEPATVLEPKWGAKTNAYFVQRAEKAMN